MDQKAAYELEGRDGRDLLLCAVGVVPPEEGNTVILQADLAVVGDADGDRN